MRDALFIGFKVALPELAQVLANVSAQVSI